MHSANALQKDLFTPGSVISKITAQGRTWKVVGALVGLGGGLVSPLVGSAVTVIGWLSGPTWHGLIQHIGTALFVLSLPLLVVGAHCLDLIDRGGRR